MRLAICLVALAFIAALGTASAQMQSMETERGALIVELSTVPELAVPGEVVIKLNFVNPTTQNTQIHIDYSMDVTKDGEPYIRAASHTAEGSVSIPSPLEDVGTYDIDVNVTGILFTPITPQSAFFALNVGVDNPPTDTMDMPEPNGGCLIATATYGTEMADQVQMLREIRDNTLLSTSTGVSFMSTFNDIYYTFSPTVADLQRQSPEIKSVVGTMITPMIASLSIMSLADTGSDSDVLGLGMAVIALNLGLYAGVPVLAVFTIRSALVRRS